MSTEPLARGLIQAERLERAIDAAHINVTELARRLAGERADRERVESKRRLVYKHLAGQGIGDGAAEDYAVALGTDPDYFKERLPPRRLRTDELREIREELEDLADRIGRVEGALSIPPDAPQTQHVSSVRE